MKSLHQVSAGRAADVLKRIMAGVGPDGLAPSARDMSAEMGISVSAISKATSRLREDGVIKTRRGVVDGLQRLFVTIDAVAARKYIAAATEEPRPKKPYQAKRIAVDDAYLEELRAAAKAGEMCPHCKGERHHRLRRLEARGLIKIISMRVGQRSPVVEVDGHRTVASKPKPPPKRKPRAKIITPPTRPMTRAERVAALVAQMQAIPAPPVKVMPTKTDEPPDDPVARYLRGIDGKERARREWREGV